MWRIKILCFWLGCIWFVGSGCSGARHAPRSTSHTFSDTTLTRLLPLIDTLNFPLKVGQEINLSEVGVRVRRVSGNEVLVSSPVRESVRHTVQVVPVKNKTVQKIVQKPVQKIVQKEKTVQDSNNKSVQKSVQKKRWVFQWWWLILLLIGYGLYRYAKRFFPWFP